MYWVYVLCSLQGRIYIGQTDNLDRRVAEHNSVDHNRRKYTSKFPGPWRLIHHEEFASRSEAMKREKWLKGTTGRRWIKNQFMQGASPSVKLPD